MNAQFQLRKLARRSQGIDVIERFVRRGRREPVDREGRVSIRASN